MACLTSIRDCAKLIDWYIFCFFFFPCLLFCFHLVFLFSSIFHHFHFSFLSIFYSFSFLPWPFLLFSFLFLPFVMSFIFFLFSKFIFLFVFSLSHFRHIMWMKNLAHKDFLSCLEAALLQIACILKNQYLNKPPVHQFKNLLFTLFLIRN